MIFCVIVRSFLLETDQMVYCLKLEVLEGLGESLRTTIEMQRGEVRELGQH